MAVRQKRTTRFGVPSFSMCAKPREEAVSDGDNPNFVTGVSVKLTNRRNRTSNFRLSMKDNNVDIQQEIGGDLNSQ